MRKQLLAGAAALALGMAMTTSAMAFSQSGFHSDRFEGLRGFSGWRDGGWGSRRFGGGYGRHRDGDYGGSATETYCPAFSRCGAGLP
jgi:hypothetical protein